MKRFPELEQVEEQVANGTVQGGGDMYESNARCGEEGRPVIPREAAGCLRHAIALTKLRTGTEAARTLTPILCQRIHRAEKISCLVPGEGNVKTPRDCLMAHSHPPEELAAIVSHASISRQHVIETKLAGLGCAADRAEPPAVITLDSVVALRSQLDWLGRLEAG